MFSSVQLGAPCGQSVSSVDFNSVQFTSVGCPVQPLTKFSAVQFRWPPQTVSPSVQVSPVQLGAPLRQSVSTDQYSSNGRPIQSVSQFSAGQFIAAPHPVRQSKSVRDSTIGCAMQSLSQCSSVHSVQFRTLVSVGCPVEPLRKASAVQFRPGPQTVNQSVHFSADQFTALQLGAPCSQPASAVQSS